MDVSPPPEQEQVSSGSNTPASTVKHELESLGVGLMDQSSLEKQIMAEASKAMNERDDALDLKRLDKARRQLREAQEQLKKLKAKVQAASTTFDKDRLTQKINEQATMLGNARRDEADILQRMKDRKKRQDVDQDMNKRQANETQREFLIRTGKITPFSNIPDTLDDDDAPSSGVRVTLPGSSGMSHQHLKRPSAITETANAPMTTGRRGGQLGAGENDDLIQRWQATRHKGKEKQRQRAASDDEYMDEDNGLVGRGDQDSAEEYADESDTMDLVDDDDENEVPKTAKQIQELFEDDGDASVHQKRVQSWAHDRQLLRYRQAMGDGASLDLLDEWVEEQGVDIEAEMFEPHPDFPDEWLGKLRVPGDIWSDLFDYQRTCVQWLWELHQQKVGGIIGDEMGLGKTVQLLAFLSSLYYSKILGPGLPSLIVCPATVLKQWVEECHRWFPPLAVAILHASGSGVRASGATTDQSSDVEMDDENDEMMDGDDDNRDFDVDRRGKFAPDFPKKKTRDDTILFTKSGRKAGALVNRFIKIGGILVTTYAGVQTYRRFLLKHRWGYVVLDEGHKIRNPDSETTLVCKQFKTSHRIILSGTPIQNNLKELWSLFDFIFPGRLGTLPVFQTQFSVPINIGGYANATNIQVQTAYKCACMLRDLINPYLLRRMKVDVASDLPKKTEQVLFCKLTPQQRQSYLQFIQSQEMDAILERRRQVLYGIDIVRKICNHPDLLAVDKHRQDRDHGSPEKSGKMQVVKALLHLWESEQHRVLLFCQTRQMLDLLEKMINNLGYRYRRMDGTTPIHHRMTLVHEFNTNPEIYVFLLTTKVGGLGLNLTGANRVILFDPDWNPSTDMQARERAWRLGQKKQVTIYRLMTSGTIEEKIYHRQIYKQFLTNKILKDPKQRRFFDASNLKSLFTLADEDAPTTETGQLFQGTEIQQKGSGKKRKRANDDDRIKALEGVSSLEAFASGPPGEGSAQASTSQAESRNQNEGGHDDHVLSSLFEMTGIHSALQHDRIMDADGHDTFFVEREASLIAEQAAKALKESRKRTRLNKVGTPTWTGRSGIAGAPQGTPPPRFGQKANAPASSASILANMSSKRAESAPSSPTGHFGKGNLSGFKGTTSIGSSTLLQQMRQRKEMEKNRAAAISTPPADLTRDKQQWIERIRDYLASQDGRASSSDILAHLNIEVNANDIVIFRKMLQAIAIFTKDPQGKGIWVLKNEFA